MRSVTQKADTISRQRTWYFGALAMVLVTHQGLFWRWNGQAIGLEESLTWSLLVATILFALASGGQAFVSRAIRDLVDDDVTRVNRTKALSHGFIVTIAFAVVIFAVSPLVQITSQRAIHLVVSIGLIAALTSFVFEERKALG